MKRFLFIAILFILQAPESDAQTREDFLPYLRDSIQIELNDGSRIYGELVDVTENELKVFSSTGSVSVPVSMILRYGHDLQVLKTIKERGPSNPHFGATMPTGFGSKGFQFRSDLGLFNRISYGFTDRFSITIGGIIVIGEGELPLAIMPKYSIPLNFGHFSTSVIFGKHFGSRPDSFTFGTWVNSLTIGDNLNYINFSLGSTFSTPSKDPEFLSSVGGRIRLYKGFGMSMESLYPISSNEFINTLFLEIRIKRFELGLGTLHAIEIRSRSNEHEFLPLVKLVYRQ